eukprot:755602_1
MMLALSIANLLPIYRLGTKHVWIAKACVKPAKFSIYVGALAETQVSIQQQNDALAETLVSIQQQNDALSDTQVSIQQQNDALSETQVSIQQQNDAILERLTGNEDFIEGLTLGSVDNSYGGESIDIG